ncbi:COP1-interacting protein 7-like [Impatiens glandulifera]|uniref:COP1-interacting protein 7-like n=1 Tax=Impatiens glandulifera TaxID=253017 RepID=UPI001FB0CC82|nr:COP1-interacting protein 7-like [Impatiens glandulifera]
MRSSTLLDSAIFHLTPTRTRCDLLITANGKTEKIASGLLNPFLAHLKTAQDQIAKGGYSILLEPERRNGHDDDDDVSWFTKDSLERFVRFVSTPDILERVYTIESEMLQIEESIVIQRNNDAVINNVEHRQSKSITNHEASNTMRDDANEEKGIVLYKPDDEEHEGNGSEENSKVKLLKVLESRKLGLQKEQGMAFARAVAAGFDIDHMNPLVSFAECFGATRLMNACLRFMDLWKRKHESGQWLEIETDEAMCNRSSDFCTMNAMLFSSTVEEQNDDSAEKRNLVDQKEGYIQGQIPQPIFFPPWPMHSPPGTVQGVPYYHGSLYQPPYQMDNNFSPNIDSRVGRSNKRNSLEEFTKEDSEIYQKKTSRSSKKKPDAVIRNSSDCSDSEEELSSSLKRKGNEYRSSKLELYKCDNREERSYGNEIDNGGHWQAFQNLLLRDADEDKHVSDKEKKDESFIVPFRTGNVDRTAIDVESELPSKHQKLEYNSSRSNKKTSYEQYDLNLKKHEGRAKKETAGYDPALESNKSQNNRIKSGNVAKSLNRTTDKKKYASVGGPIRKVKKPSKMSQLDDAKARADKLRSYKADLQKMKKEMEAKEMKRLEALKIERQKRIATRGSSSLPSPQSKKQLPSKLFSPSSHPGSKFSDLQPAASSPLQRSKIRNASLMSKNESNRASKTGNNNNRLVKSVSSLPDPNKKDNVAVTVADTKASMARIRRLSEPRTVGPESVSKPKVVSSSSGRPDSKKISAIINLDKRKSATLPELKIRTSSKRTMDGRTKLTTVNGTKSSSAASETKNVLKITAHDNDDDMDVIEKAVVILECEKKPSVVVQQTCLFDDLKKSEVRNNNEGSEERQKNFGGKTVVEKHNQPIPTPSYATRPEMLVDRRVAETTKVIQHISGPHNSLKLERIPEILEKSPKGLKRFLNFGKKNKNLAGVSYYDGSDAAADGGRAVSSEVGSSNTLKNLISQSLDEYSDSASTTTPQKSSRHNFSLLSPFRSSKKSSEKKNQSS